MYKVKESYYHPKAGEAKANDRLLSYFAEKGLKIGDDWNFVDYADWVMSHYRYDR